MRLSPPALTPLFLATTLLAGPAVAQSTAPTPGNSAPIVTVAPNKNVAPGQMQPPVNRDAPADTAGGAPANAPANAPASNPASNPAGAPAAGTAAPDSNAGLVTTGAQAMAQPAHGANSFTQGEAQSRLTSNGFTAVTGLTLDSDGVWRGRGTRGGKTGDLWLDYRGNYGTP